MAPHKTDSGFEQPLTCKVRDKTLNLESPIVMGVLNATPDSFSDGGQFNELEDALDRINTMIREGAGIIDIGGESTRPGAEPVPAETERSRVIPVLDKAIARYPDIFFSIDTRTYEVAREALERGVHIVNDVSGLQKEPRLAELCAQYNAGYILMHSQGEPQNMQNDPRYEYVISDIKNFFEKQLDKAAKAGLDNVILDPGIGFGKTQEHNIELLAELESFLEFGQPLMVGVSRKSMLDEILGGRPPQQRVAATVAAHYEAMIRGARILRVHDVREAYDSVRVFNALHQEHK